MAWIAGVRRPNTTFNHFQTGKLCYISSVLDEKVKYYTGLPYWTLLQPLHTVIIPCLTKASRKLSPFQMLLLALIRLRLHLPKQHLACLLQISHTTSKIFRETMGVLHFHLAPLVHWPARHCLQHTMPHQFVEPFGSHVAVILDCFEIGTEKPSNLKAQAQTYSHYKQKHTVKYLIGITPQGSITFISKGWGGHVSDKYLTEQCGILNKLLPGDLVLADCGFNIGDEVGLMCAEVKTPGFTRGCAQMDPKSVKDTRQIAHLRVHVERVTGLVCNKYNILQRTIPVSQLVPLEGEEFSFIDKIVTVCWDAMANAMNVFWHLYVITAEL
uniref:DDE Tnp4 domain-containing protein n=1 Tax=Amphiprion ocellaris TaxID=80972 RepID=A0A3Q1B870_AMPOC